MTEKTKEGHRGRVRERFTAGETNSRSDEALLELLLSYAIPRIDVQPLARNLLARFGSLSGVLDADRQALCSFGGIKGSSAVLIKLVDWIRNHYASPVSTQTQVAPEIAEQPSLFESATEAVEAPAITPPQREPRKPSKVRARRGTELFGKVVLKEAIELLPCLPDTESLDEIRQHLRGRLHFNAEETRHRYANYIVRRMFPGGYADRGLRCFAKLFAKRQELREVCFYRFMKAEPLLQQAIHDLLLPALGSGRLARRLIREYLKGRYPTAASIGDCAKGIVDALVAGGIAKADLTKIAFSYREIPPASFAFVLHGEFQEAGMYNIELVEANPTIRAMLWDPGRIVPSLYELRNQSLIGKVSQIDNVRQFTTRWTLDELVDHMGVEVA
jgi:DNA repair protein RadC